MDQATKLLFGVMIKIIDVNNILLLSPYLPHFLVFAKVLLILNAYLILLHCFILIVSPFPYFTVLVVKNSVISRLRKRLF